MMQAEHIEDFGRFLSAKASAESAMASRIERLIEPTIGTAIAADLPETEGTTFYFQIRDTDYVTNIIGSYPSTKVVRVFSDSNENENRLDVAHETKGVNIGMLGIAGAGEPSDTPYQMPSIVDYARRHGLPEIAERLAELFMQPLGDDERPLQGQVAVPFVNYCLAREKARRPLMTVTPTGELDVTWNNAAGKKVLMRFFEDGRVWVAYRLSKERGSFEMDARDLVRQSLHFKLPAWA